MEKNFDRGLLKDEFVFTGKHAKMVQRLKEPISQMPSFFSSNVEVFIAASQVGIIEEKTAKSDKSTPETAKILADQMNQHSLEITRNFRIAMLLHEKETISIEERLERAFLSDNKYEKRKSLEEIFFSYVLGGLEIIYYHIYGRNGEVRDIDEAIRNSQALIEMLHDSKIRLSGDVKDILNVLGD